MSMMVACVCTLNINPDILMLECYSAMLSELSFALYKERETLPDIFNSNAEVINQQSF